MQANKKLVQQHISKTSGKVVTLKDLSNLRAQMEVKSGNSTELEALVEDLTAIEGLSCKHIYVASLYFNPSNRSSIIMFVKHRYIT